MSRVCAPTASRRRWRHLTAWGAVAVAALAGQALRGVLHPEHGDLVAFLTGARLAGSDPGCLYCPGAQAAAQAQVLGHPADAGTNPFVNPPLAALLLRPLGGLSLSAAMAVFTALSLAGLGAAGWVLARDLPAGWSRPQRALTALAAVTVLPAGGALAYGQWSPLLLLAAAVALRLARRGDGLGCGLVLAALLLKPQLVWLVIPALAVAGARRSLVGLGAGALAWAASGLLITGPGGMTDWVHTVAGAHVAEVGKTAGLPGLAGAAGAGDRAAFATSLLLGLAALGLLWAVRDRLRGDLPLTLGLGLALSLVCSPHVFGGDLLLLAVPVAVMAERAPAAALAAALGLSLAWALDQAAAGGLPRLEAVAALAMVVWMATSAAGRNPAPAPAALGISRPAALTRL